MISGSVVALVTPMLKNGDIDWPCLERIIEKHIESKTSAIVSMGTTGESATLTVAEHCNVIRRTVDVVNKRIPVIAGTGSNSTSEAIELTQQAKDHKADACLLVTPYYNKPTQEGLYLHYKQISEAVAIPQILYNVPGRTVCDLENATVERLATSDNIIGIKDATGDLDRGKDLIDRVGSDLIVLSGDDETFVDLMALGAKGNISVTANVIPSLMSKICTEALNENFNLAYELNNQIKMLHASLFCESNPIPVKWALHYMKWIEEGIRLPLTPLSDTFHEQIIRELEAALNIQDINID
jgi:4-hydroxy-tetrahydrodipicolinate synthase